MLIPSSHDFTTLCESQATLLAQVMGASWSAIYLTENPMEPTPAQLRPLVSYPHSRPPDPDPLVWEPLPETLGERTAETSVPFKDRTATAITPQPLPWEEGARWGPRQVILPLLHEEMVLGLLVSRRSDRPWQEVELTQIGYIAQTLGVACFLDQQSQRLRQELTRYTHNATARQERLDLVLHQLRSPLTALRTLGKLLLKHFLPGDRNYPVAESLVREGDRLKLLIEQLETLLAGPPTPTYALPGQASPPLLLSPQTPSAPLSLLPSARLNQTEINLAQLIKPLLVAMTEVAHQQGIALSALIHPELLPIQGDAIALREVFSNLLDNAIKYTPAAGSITVEVGLEAGNELGVAIQDTGLGIPTHDQAHIFERQYRGVQANGEIPGTGLGLAIVQDLLTQMQGRIEVISPNPGQNQGTTFTVWLPLA
ncbi:MAG: HAMP domain-containing sensor histidine kinase [Cyanobacteria bacterium P01_G01_bin.54]